MKYLFPALCWAILIGGFLAACAAPKPCPDPNEILFPFDTTQGVP